MAKKDKKEEEDKRKLSYLIQAAKMTPYEVNVYDKVIYVPKNELAIAAEDLMVKHLTGVEHKFHIQSCIPEATEKKEVYNPVLSNTPRPVVMHEISRFKVGQMFKVVSTCTVMSIVRTEKGKIELAYLTQDERLKAKENLLVSIQYLEDALRKETIVEYNQ